MSNQSAFDYMQKLASTQKITKGSGDDEGISTFLCVSIQREKYYIGIEQVSEIISKTSISPVGHTASWFEGITKVQGEVYSVVDITYFLKKPMVTDKGRFAIALVQGNSNYALLANAVIGITKIKVPQVITEDNYIDLYKLPEETIKVIALDRLLSSSEFANVSIF